MARHWTESERNQQAMLIKKWQPWQHSTGPRTRKGKMQSALNAQKSITVLDVRKLGVLLKYGEDLDDLK